MKFFSASWLVFAVVLLTGCSKEKPAETPPAPPPEPPVLKQEIQTLHKAEELNQVVRDTTAEQRKEIEAATQ